MPKVQMNCPRCRQPLVAEVEQLFDVGADPQAKQRFLSGGANTAQCQKCGYQGPLAVPLVYHDPAKDLLLTYFPPELGLPLNEQERLIGPYITQVVNRLPPEKRKAYIFRPQSMLTLQTMIDKILEADGITKEMVEESQKKLNLLQRLVSANPTSRPEIVQQEEALIDKAFFQMLSRLIEASLNAGDQNSARALAQLQQEILPLTAVGRDLMQESAEVQAAIQSLQEASKKGLTRDILLDMLVRQKSEAALTAVVSMTRTGLDYEFFQILTERIEQAPDDVKELLNKLREKLLVTIQEIDKRVNERMQSARIALTQILAAPNLEQALQEHEADLDEFFAETLETELKDARKNADLAKSAKIQKIIELIQSAATPPPEFALIEELIATTDEAALRGVLEANSDKITTEFLQMINGLANQMEQEGQAEMSTRLQDIYRVALRFSMETNLRKQ
jgi:hypothetical protein